MGSLAPIPRLASALLALAVAGACAHRPEDAQPLGPDPTPPVVAVTTAPAPVLEETLPTAPLDLAGPPDPAPTREGRDLSRLGARVLYTTARSAAARGHLESALQHAAWAVQKGGRGHLLLARVHARRGEIDDSFYWLQRAAVEEGIAPASAATDADLAPLRDDERWPAVASFLEQTAAAFAGSGLHAEVLIGPGRRGPARPVLVGLHANGSEPADFLDGEAYRRRARRLGVTFVGPSGPIPLGPKTYAWSRDPGENARRIRAALAEARRRVRFADDQVILFGFSEGAQVALETAAREPERYRGAIAMSPRGGWRLDQVPRSDGIRRQGYVVAFGTFESFDTVGTSYVDADLLRELGARVDVHPAWFYGSHRLPPDYEVRLPHWIRFVLDQP